jgi:hypothetical protein
MNDAIQSRIYWRGLVTLGAARWLISKPKIPIWVNFGGSCNEKCWYICWPFGPFYGHLGYFVTIWYILRSFGTFFRLLV